MSFPLERVFEFFANPRNLPRIMPLATDTRIEQLKLVAPSPSPLGSQTRNTDLAGVGSEIFTSFLVLPPLPFRTSWVAAITEFAWNHHIADIQKEGPFRRWRHRHEFASHTRHGIQGTVVRDVIEYEAGFGFRDYWLRSCSSPGKCAARLRTGSASWRLFFRKPRPRSAANRKP